MNINRLNLLLFIILCFQGTTAYAQQRNAEKQRTVLFDGTSTNSWMDPKSKTFPEYGWKTDNKILTVLAKTENAEGGHDIISKKQFSNFVLELEVLLSEGANSGIKYMVVDTYPGKAGQYLGLEYQLIDNERHEDAKLGRNGNRKMGALYDILPIRENIKINPAGEWNKVKIVVDGNHVEHWLNDQKAIVYYRNSDSYKELVRMSKYNNLKDFGGQNQGHILLQGHGNEVSFRNITITSW